MNVSKWDNFYSTNPTHHHAPESYRRAAAFLEDCSRIEDWGCGHGGFMRYCPRAIGIDGSAAPAARKKFIDLTTYRSPGCDGIHMRHVLEHNYRWRDILRGALTSAGRKLVVTLFIPLEPGPLTRRLALNPQFGNVPDLGISQEQFAAEIDQSKWQVFFETISDSETQYGIEQIFYFTRW